MAGLGSDVTKSQVYPRARHRSGKRHHQPSDTVAVGTINEVAGIPRMTRKEAARAGAVKHRRELPHR